MKILIYQPRVSYYTGGGEIYPLQTAKFFSLLGHDVTILTTKATYLKFSEYFNNFINENKKVKIDYLELDENYKDIYDEPAGISWQRWDKESLWVSRLAYEYMLIHKFDIVTVHCVIDSFAVPFNQKHVLHLHGIPEELNYACKLIIPKEKNLIAVSQKVADKWRDYGINQEIKISTNAIDDKVFFPIDNVVKDIDLLFVGRLIPIKGIQYILQSLKILANKYDIKPKLRIIGDGPYKQNLQALAIELGLTEQIEFLGLASTEVLFDSYQRAKLAVLPSYNKEGIISTLLEAASCATVAITTKGTSMEEFAGNNENALLVNAEDSGDLSEKIYQLLSNNDYAKKIANNAYRTVKSKYTWIEKAKELIELYKEAK